MVLHPSRRRLAVSIIGLLLAVNLLLVASVAFPLGESEPHPAGEAPATFSVDDNPPFAVSGSVTVDGEQALAIEGAVDAKGEGVAIIREADPETVTEVYQSGPGAPMNQRTHHGPSVDTNRFVEAITSDETRILTSVEENDDRVTVTSVDFDPSSNIADRIDGAASVITMQLRIVAYERTKKTGETTMFRPRTGWYGPGDGYRVTEADGSVVTGPAGESVTDAAVSWRVIEPAPTYAHYLLYRSDAFDQSVRLENRQDPEPIEEPDWVTGAGEAVPEL